MNVSNVERVEMKNKPKWYVILFVGLLLLLASPIVACASTLEPSVPATEDSKVESYLSDADAILNEATKMALEAVAIYKVVNQLDKSEISQIFADYDKDYAELLERFAELHCPPECEKLQEHALSGISYFKQEVAELGMAYSTGSSLDKAKEYYNRAQRELLIGANEQDRLRGY